MREFLSNDVFPNQAISITVQALIFIGLILIAVFVINFSIGRFIRHSRLFIKVERKRKRLIYNVLRLAVWVLGISLILGIIGLDLKSFWNFYLIGPGEEDEAEKFTLQTHHVFWAAFVIFFTRIAITGLGKAFSNWSHFREDDKGRSKAVFKFLSYIVWFVAILFIINSTGTDLTVIWGAGAALLVGVGLGLQQIIADLVSGVFLLFEGNLREGDVVELNNGVIGRVEHVGIRTSKILTRDDYIMIIPNSQFIVEEVINWTHNEENTRFHINVGVAYGSNTRLVEKVLLDSAKIKPEISINPAPFVRFENFGDSSLDFQLFFWSTKTFRIENLKSDLRFLIDQNFRENEIQIPFPQRDVHIKGTAGQQ